MKRLTITLLALLIAGPAYGQWVVSNPTGDLLTKTQIGKTVQQIAKMKKQIELTKNQLMYAKQKAQREVEALKGLPNRDWSNIEDINQNMHRFDRAVENIGELDGYIEQRYRYLYDEFERQKLIEKNPDRAEEIQRDRTEHTIKEAEKLLGTGGAAGEGAREIEAYLKSLQKEMAEDNLSPQQMREINGKIMGAIAQQINQTQKVLAQYAAFSAQQARASENQKKDNAVRDSVHAEQIKATIKKWRENIKDQKHGLGEVQEINTNSQPIN